MPLVANIPFNIYFAKSVLANKVAGVVIVDDIDNHRTAYIRHYYGMSLLCGDFNSVEFNRRLLDFLLHDYDFPRAEYLQVYPNEWNQILRNSLDAKLVSCDNNSDRQYQAVVVEHVRVNFKFDIGRYQNIINHLDLHRYDIRQLDAATALAYQGLVVSRYYWYDAKTFDLYALAHGLYIDGELATVAFSSCRDDKILELGMETVEKFRGRGLAQMVCLKLIVRALQLGLEPIWACREGNVGSYKLALKVGFIADSKWSYYQIMRKK